MLYEVITNLVADYLGFVETGMFQFFYENDAEEITTYIALKNDFVLSVPVITSYSIHYTKLYEFRVFIPSFLGVEIYGGLFNVN